MVVPICNSSSQDDEVVRLKVSSHPVRKNKTLSPITKLTSLYTHNKKQIAASISEEVRKLKFSYTIGGSSAVEYPGSYSGSQLSGVMTQHSSVLPKENESTKFLPTFITSVFIRSKSGNNSNVHQLTSRQSKCSFILL